MSTATPCHPSSPCWNIRIAALQNKREACQTSEEIHFEDQLNETQGNVCTSFEDGF